MRSIFLFCAVVLFYTAPKAQTPKAVALADSLLKAGAFKAAITTYDFPEDIKRLQQKAVKNLNANPKWKGKYIIRMVERGDADISDNPEEYGLTAEEFRKMQEGFKAGKNAVFADTMKLVIKKANGVITFKGESRLALFNYLSIDTRNSIIYYDNLKLTSELELKSPKNSLIFLIGIEAYMSEETGRKNVQKEIYGFSLAIGTDRNDTRPVLCLIYGKSANGKTYRDPEFLTITIL